MTDLQLLEELKKLLHRKKNNQYYANILGVSAEEVEELREELKKQKKLEEGEIYRELCAAQGQEESAAEERKIVECLSDREKGTEKVSFFHSREALSDTEIYREAKKDPLLWRIAQIWHLKKGLGFLHSVLFKPLESTPEDFQQKFIQFLSTFSSGYIPIEREPHPSHKTNACLLIPKQDFHFNKLDILGDNDIGERQQRDGTITELFVQKASAAHNLQKVFYVLGSDYFNSEWTKLTTKGTPQENFLGYHDSFALACIHELCLIQSLLKHTQEVEIIFIAGNHDFYVGWHLVQWLAAYFKTEKRVVVDANPSLRKYISFSDTAIMLAHGNEVKPQQLAHIFPKEYKEHWSQANHFYLLTGDKHQEKSGDYGMIRHYQVPALSSAKSLWDSTNGFVANRVEHSAFVIEEGKGFSNFYREVVN